MVTHEYSDIFDRPVGTADPHVARLLAAQAHQGQETVNLVASESYCPRATLEAEASAFVNKNASGYPPRAAVGGGEFLDAVERLAIDRARQLFGAEHANVQALSSTIANVAVLRALLPRGSRILAFGREAGGHSSHGAGSHLSGQDYAVESFGADGPGETIDYAAVARQAEAVRPQMIIAGTTSYPLAIDFERLGTIAKACGALLFADIAHVSGLVVAGLHQNPCAVADVVTTSTHKTLCGPRTGGLILSKAIHGAAIDRALSPGLQAAPGGHIIAGRAVLFEMVAQPWFPQLMRQVVTNAAALADTLRRHGIRLYAGGTDTHMVVADLRATDWTVPVLNAALLAHGIIGSTTGLPARPGNLGLRLGSTAMTIRGARPDQMVAIGESLAGVLLAGPTAAQDAVAATRMGRLARELPIPFQAL